MLNKIIIQARLCKDVELRRLPSGKAVASVSVACDRDFSNKETNERETDFIDIVAFGGTGEFMEKYFHKGSMAIVTGRLQIRNWTDKDGNKRRTAEVVADNVYFGDSKKEDSKHSASAPAQDFQQIDIPDAQLPF
jgi:single-strand DNA-binding protein